jgi:hypothetical protein
MSEQDEGHDEKSAPPVSWVKGGNEHGKEVAGDYLVVMYADRDSKG